VLAFVVDERADHLIPDDRPDAVVCALTPESQVHVFVDVTVTDNILEGAVPIGALDAYNGLARAL